MAVTRDRKAWKVIQTRLADVSVALVSDEMIAVTIVPRRGHKVRVVVVEGSNARNVWEG